MNLDENVVRALLKVRPDADADIVKDLREARLDSFSLDSLDLTSLCIEIEESTGVVIEVSEISEETTVQDLIELVNSRGSAER